MCASLLLLQLRETHSLCFSHFEPVTNWTAFCTLAKIMYLGFLSDILNTFFSVFPYRAHSLVEFLSCGRPAKAHSHTHTPRCGPMGSVLSHCFNSQTFVAKGCSPISWPTTTVGLCAVTYLFAWCVLQPFFFPHLPLIKLKLWKVCLQEKGAQVPTASSDCREEGPREPGRAGRRGGDGMGVGLHLGLSVSWPYIRESRNGTGKMGNRKRVTIIIINCCHHRVSF